MPKYLTMQFRFIFSFMVVILSGCQTPSTEKDLLTYVDGSGKYKSVKTKEDWEIKRKQVLQGMEEAMGKLPSREGLPPMDITCSDSINTGSYTRYTIRFTVADGEILPAFLYIPHKKPAAGKFPAMLALHPTDSIGKKIVDGQGKRPNRAYAKELAERGYLVIAPDYPGFGDLLSHDFSKDRYQSGTMKSIFNHMRCVDLLISRDDVDPEKIGVIGHSLGGHNAMFAGVFDTRLKVIVSSSGWTPFAYYDIGEEGTKRYGGRLGPWAQDKYMPLLREKYNLDGNKFPFDFPEMIAAFAPRAFFSNSPEHDSNFDVKGVRAGITEASQIYRLFSRENQLQVRYPDAQHDFPQEVRMEAYRFIDSVLLQVKREK